MKKIIYILFLMFISVMSYGKESKGIFYKAIKDEKTIYLLGTIGGNYKELLPLQKEIQENFAKTKTIVVKMKENGDKNFGNNNLLKTFMEKGFYIDGDKLKNHLSDKSMNILRESFKTSLSESEINFFRPVTALIISLYRTLTSNEDVNNLEKYLINESKDKEIIGLSTIEEIFEIFLTFTDSEVNYLIESIEDENDSDYYKNRKKAWIKGNEKKLRELNIPESDLEYQMCKKFITDNNYKEAEKLDELVNERKEIFVIVDCSNLIYDGSILDLLKNKGYKIDKVD